MDDTELYVSFSPNRSADADFAIKSMTDCISDIRSWIISDNVMLNDNKTELSSWLDEQLTMSTHISNCCLLPFAKHQTHS